MKYRYYEEIFEEKQLNNEKILYQDQLSTIEWKNKRNSIIQRDNNICTCCKSMPSIFKKGKAYRKQTITEKEIEFKELIESEEWKEWFELFGTYPKIGPRLIPDLNPTILHVHHKYYVINKLAWNYPDDALITLCKDCHQKLHNTQRIPIFLDESLETELDYEICDRCNGSGYLKEFHYYQNGTCFKCNGEIFIK